MNQLNHQSAHVHTSIRTSSCSLSDTRHPNHSPGKVVFFVVGNNVLFEELLRLPQRDGRVGCELHSTELVLGHLAVVTRAKVRLVKHELPSIERYLGWKRMGFKTVMCE